MYVTKKNKDLDIAGFESHLRAWVAQNMEFSFLKCNFLICKMSILTQVPFEP